jgi:CDP-diacylglycerol--glycerol-3-phosphate 3-phosphatidyltransferase
MASIYDLKPRFQNRLRPWVNVLASAGITANQVTVTATMLSMAGGGFIATYHQHHWPLLFIPLILFVRMALNAIDGMLAREHDMQTPLGAILNELGDVVSDIALYLPLGLVGGVSGSWIVAIVLLAIVSEMTGVLAAQIGAQRRYDGPMGKSDRAVVFGSIGLILGIGIAPGIWLDMVLGAVTLLLIVTVINRARRALQEVRS